MYCYVHVTEKCNNNKRFPVFNKLLLDMWYKLIVSIHVSDHNYGCCRLMDQYCRLTWKEKHSAMCLVPIHLGETCLDCTPVWTPFKINFGLVEQGYSSMLLSTGSRNTSIQACLDWQNCFRPKTVCLAIFWMWHKDECWSIASTIVFQELHSLLLLYSLSLYI